MIMTRKILKLEEYITLEHIESMNKVILVTGTIVGVAYLKNYLLLGIPAMFTNNLHSLIEQWVFIGGPILE